MASADVQHPPNAPHTFSGVSSSSVASEPSPVSKDVHTELNFYLDTGAPPEPAYVGKPESYNRPVDTRKVTIHDVRGREKETSLDTVGFQYVNHESKEKTFDDDERVKAEYYPEVEELIKSTTGASRVYIFDHTIRRAEKDFRGPVANADPEKPITLRGPVQRVHIDQSYSASENRVEHHFPNEYKQLQSKRFQIINLWRPIKTIRKDPLTVASAPSVSEEDLVPVGLIYPDRKGETLSVKPNDKQEWFFLRDQRPDEPLLIKCYDTKTDGRARRVPHSAFVDPDTVDLEGRESIEVRTLVFYDEDR